MTNQEIIALINEHYDAIKEALREADRKSYKYTTCKYSVALYEDGHMEIRERLAGDNWWYQNDPAVIEFGAFCHQYYDVLRDNLASDELLTLLETDMAPDEKVKYIDWRNKYEESECDEPDDWDVVNWIEEHMTDLWDRETEMAAEELTTSQEADTEYEAIIDEQIKFLEMDF